MEYLTKGSCFVSPTIGRINSPDQRLPVLGRWKARSGQRAPLDAKHAGISHSLSTIETASFLQMCYQEASRSLVSVSSRSLLCRKVCALYRAAPCSYLLSVADESQIHFSLYIDLHTPSSHISPAIMPVRAHLKQFWENKIASCFGGQKTPAADETSHAPVGKHTISWHTSILSREEPPLTLVISSTIPSVILRHQTFPEVTSSRCRLFLHAYILLHPSPDTPLRSSRISTCHQSRWDNIC